MDKLPQETPDLTQQNIDRIAELFPSAITETKDADGKLKKAINFTTLKQLLSADVVDGDECYEFTWVGKKLSIIEGNKPIRKTLRPAKDESKNWDTTENLYIEGDNLEVLKLLQNSYLNSIKMIYIDPPYNTGNDFVYRDDFAVSREEYEGEMGVYDEEENRLFKNTETNGRFHSDWCSMMYPRLQLARNLLSDDGVIFISINDVELKNLKNISDEVFGEGNFIAQLNIITGANQSGDGVKIQRNVEYCLVYSKTQNSLITKVDKISETYRNINDAPTPLETRPDMGYTVYFNPQTKDLIPLKDYNKNKIKLNNVMEVYIDNIELVEKGYIPIRPGVRNQKLHRWRWGIETFLERKNEIVVIEKKGEYTLNFKQEGLNSPKNYYNFSGGALELKNLFGDTILFDYPKGLSFIKYITDIGTTKNSIILDFFSGSATTAHAVMQLNAEDGGNRKFIMVQLPETTDEKSEAYKAGYRNICEIGKERIRRAGKKIEEELQAKSTKSGLFDNEQKVKKVDTGFRVLKLDDTNMKDVYYSAGDYSQQMLLDLESNIKEDRTDLDLLFGVMLDWGVPLSLPHITENIGGKQVHFVNGADLVACFEENITEMVVREIAKRKPLRVVFRDNSFGSSPEKINVSEIFKTLSPDTTVKVI